MFYYCAVNGVKSLNCDTVGLFCRPRWILVSIEVTTCKSCIKKLTQSVRCIKSLDLWHADIFRVTFEDGKWSCFLLMLELCFLHGGRIQKHIWLHQVIKQGYCNWPCLLLNLQVRLIAFKSVKKQKQFNTLNLIASSSETLLVKNIVTWRK